MSNIYCKFLLAIKNPEDPVCYLPLLPSKVDLQQITIFPHNEWKRIQDSLDSLTREAARLRAERKAKKQMHIRSQEVVKHWTNTAAGIKEQSLKAKKKCEEELEAERKILDMEEEMHKQEERKKAIEFAKQYQFYQTERVKKLHSGLLLSRVLKERDAQIEFKKNNIKSDKKWEEQLKHNIEKAFQEENEKAIKRQKDRMALALFHLKQIKEHEEEKKVRRKYEEKDAEEIKRQQLLYEIEIEKKKEKKKEEISENRRCLSEHINDKNIIKAVEQQHQEEEEEKTRRFIKAKKHLAKVGIEKEMERQKQEEERRERIKNLLTALMSAKVDNEDLIIARDTAEAEAEWQKREQEKMEKREAEFKAIAEHREIMMKNKEEQEKVRKIEGKERLLAMKKADQIFYEHEKEKKLKAAKERRDLQEAHVQHIAKNNLKSQKAKQAELEYWQDTNALLNKKNKEFQDYAREVINFEAESTNKYIYPLAKAAQEGFGGGHGPIFVDRGGLRPSYQANDATGVQLPSFNSQGSKYNNLKKSKGRLGFIW
ncbi:cilia- and flagella- associated protein 210 [Suncus etruscus]|uniref:cilia- and flagella- associated protein 210 n=1 Tax=Suncus etruscus TaxID=109475 RepID=UPI0021107DC4|nr:cilia- and flagella- associated protein 210 [Suncus etruscus]